MLVNQCGSTAERADGPEPQKLKPEPYTLNHKPPHRTKAGVSGPQCGLGREHPPQGAGRRRHPWALAQRRKLALRRRRLQRSSTQQRAPGTLLPQASSAHDAGGGSAKRAKQIRSRGSGHNPSRSQERTRERSKAAGHHVGTGRCPHTPNQK